MIYAASCLGAQHAWHPVACVLSATPTGTSAQGDRCCCWQAYVLGRLTQDKAYHTGAWLYTAF